MNFEEYQRSFFVRPAPDPLFSFVRVGGINLSIHSFAQACAFYREVLGPPAYVEGEDAIGWRWGMRG